MKKPCTIDAYFKRKNVETSNNNDQEQPNSCVDHVVLNSDSNPNKARRIEINESFDINALERDPGRRPQIWQCPVNIQDKVQRAYINYGPYQCILPQYPKSGAKQQRSFQASWFKLFPSWLEYSPTKDAAFCLQCFLFHKKNGPSGSDAFTVNGFRSWKKVRDGKNCAFLAHMGKDHRSPHGDAERAWMDLIDQSSHIQKKIERFTSEKVRDNRVRLKATIYAVRWLALQACAFRGDDESKISKRPGNFIQLLSYASFYNDEVSKVLQNAPKNATYTSPRIQKEILHIISTRVKNVIRAEIGDAKFSILIDEARDESKKEQMSLVLRYVDKIGCVKERFFGLVHVKDTVASTLKDGIFSALAQFNLDIHNIRGQGYDGASNMRGEWKGLQALISSVCPFAYYIHCMAHRLQLALVAASKDVLLIHQFFKKLSFIVNIVGASSKRTDQLKDVHAANIAHLLAIDQLKSGTGLNQIGTLQRHGDTRWSSHLKSVASLINMFSATCEVLLNIIDDGATVAQSADADAAYEALTSFEFVFILHLMKKILEFSDLLCHTLQLQSQDILNAMLLVSSTKSLIQKLRDKGWSDLIDDVKCFCESVNIPVPDLKAPYVARRGKARNQQDNITVEHYYKIDIFNGVIDAQLLELDNKFNDHTIELLSLSSALDPKEMLTSLRIDDIYQLVQKFYPQDFAEHEIMQLKVQLEHFNDVIQLAEFKDLSTISDLSQWLVKTRKSQIYPLVYRVVTLILTLPVSTATTERLFSAMNIIKNKLRNKIEDEFLSDCLVIYIENEIAETFTLDSLVDDFRDVKERRVPF